MQPCFVHLTGSLNNRIRILICLAVLALAAGCASTPKQTVPYPVYSDSDCRAAVKAGAEAMIDCSREHALAHMENRAADYTKARSALAGALAVLHPARLNPAKPEYERIAVFFEASLSAVDRIVAGSEQGDREAEALGWEIFDQSAQELLLVLEPHAKAAAPVTVQPDSRRRPLPRASN